MAKLSTSTSAERKEIMSRLRKLGEEMTPPTATVLTADSKPSAPAASTDDNQQQQRERLDRELEIHNATSAAQGEAGSSTEDLKAKLEKLKAEVTLNIYSSLWDKHQLLFLRLSGWESPTPRENPFIRVGRIDRIEVGVEERVDTFVEQGVAPCLEAA
jgi:hypothetical protein